ncbi:hypothetical protein FNF27_00972 [Cafeteria roenbergensis]|uniref:CMP/dCMP-type deaminase domain-containing protein n=1 Tax=Cafeteria roenbergensis TaxID=33653 RepID=A0A5A8DSX3_CAFRO|nr:hypothetical protein FNF31_00412 [Cafeteria roenbergensis]KAA0177801.1 hypothetical protein FNF27_00972 [Cafeteria roenbergensis]
MDAAGHAHASSIEAENDLAGRKRRTPQFDEIIWEPGALPLSRRLMTCIGVDVEPKATGLAVGACRGSRNVQEGMRHLKRVSSLEAQADYKSKLPTGTTPSADIMALAEGPCRIPEGKIRILVGPAAAFPDDLPPHSHCVGAGPQAVKRAEPLDESTVPSGIRTLVERGRADFVRFPVLAIPSSDATERAIESAFVWPMKPSQPVAAPGEQFLKPADEPRALEVMRLAVKAARMGRERGFRGCGAVVYDPAHDCIRAWAYDRTQWLGIPKAAAAVAASGDGAAGAAGCGSDRAGAASEDSPAPTAAAAPASAAREAEASPSAASADDLDVDPPGADMTHPLHSAALLTIESVAIADRIRRGHVDRAREARAGLHTVAFSPDGGPPLHLYNLPPLPLPAGTDEPPVAHVDQYICTGYDVYLSVEPCAMDAMALSHARVRSVVFAARDPIDGALLSRLRLHEARPLNHHYSVFQMREDSELAKEAASLWDEGDEIGVGDPFSSRLPKAGVRAGSSP